MTLYRLHGQAAIEVSKEEAQAIGADIFVRPLDVRAWIVSLDEGDKPSQLDKIRRSPLIPSYVAETHTGHQVYFAAKHPRVEAYQAVVLELLAPFFAAQGVLDYARKPGYLDCTTPVRKVWSHHVSYTERQIAGAFKRRSPASRHAPYPATSLMPTTVDEQLVIAGMLHGLADLLPFVEQDDFVGPQRMLFTAARNLEARGAEITATSLHQELRRHDLLAGTHSHELWWPDQIARLVPAQTDLVLDAAFRLAALRTARETVLAVDARYQQQQDEIDELALREVA